MAKNQGIIGDRKSRFEEEGYGPPREVTPLELAHMIVYFNAWLLDLKADIEKAQELEAAKRDE